MRNSSLIAFAFLVLVVIPGATSQAQAQKAPYPAIAPLDQYLMPDEKSEIALARSAAPASISDGAEVMVLGRTGYKTAVKGSNGFLCIVERSWGAATDDPGFWNPKVRGPICFNPSAARTFAPIFLMKTKLVLAGKSKTEIVRATASALDKKELPALEPGAMCYMLSKQQYLSDSGMNWHPHLMFFVAGSAAKSWGADLPGSEIGDVKNLFQVDGPGDGLTESFVIERWRRRVQGDEVGESGLVRRHIPVRRVGLKRRELLEGHGVDPIECPGLQALDAALVNRQEVVYHTVKVGSAGLEVMGIPLDGYACVLNPIDKLKWSRPDGVAQGIR